MLNFTFKKGIVLPYVLAFIVSLTLIVVNFTEKMEPYLNSDIYKDISDLNNLKLKILLLIDRQLSKVQNRADLGEEIIGTELIFSNKDNSILGTLKLENKSPKIDINKIIKMPNLIIDRLDSSSGFNVSESRLLFKIINDVRKSKSSIAEDDWRFVEGKKIHNIKQFNKIIDYYIESTGDEDIQKVNFEELFCFEDCKEHISCEDINDNNQKLTQLLSDEYVDNEMMYKIDCDDTQLMQELNKNFIGTYIDNTEANEVSGIIQYNEDDTQFNVTFDYDFNDQNNTKRNIGITNLIIEAGEKNF